MDLSHHINAKSKARHPSPLKDIIKYMGYEDMISLAGGLPHPSSFAIKDLVFSAPMPGNDGREEIELGNDLAKWLQYGNGAGNLELRDWCHNLTHHVHQPAYEDFEVLLTAGNTNAWSKVVGLLLEDDEYVLCEEFTYPSAQALWAPLGVHAAPIPLDDQGMRADSLEETLASWESTNPGKKRPHVLYCVPVGSNPTGVTYSAQRKKQLYDICVRYDIIIVEDDPYFFLQFPPSTLREGSRYEVVSNEEFLRGLSPSFLRYDIQGRVIRLESFSKTLAPALRLGFFVANPLFTERLLRASEVETQDPSGLSQAIAFALLQRWKFDGCIQWMQNIRILYQQRCDWMVAAFKKEFDLVPATEHPALKAQGYVAVLEKTPIFSFVPPTGGMFIFAKFYLDSNPTFQRLRDTVEVDDPEQSYEANLWEALAQELVLLTPGSYYVPWQGKGRASTRSRGAQPSITHFRFAFSMAMREEMERGISRFAKVVRKAWNL